VPLNTIQPLDTYVYFNSVSFEGPNLQIPVTVFVPLSFTIRTSKHGPFIILYVHSSVKPSESTHESLHSLITDTYTKVNTNANAASSYHSCGIMLVICKQCQCDLFPSHVSFLWDGSVDRSSQNNTHTVATMQACMCFTLLLPTF
jgi:hypothetical protein